MSAPLVRVEQYDRIAVVVFARPEKRNAMTPELFEEWFAALPGPDAIDGLVLAGDGPVFCGGFDLKMCLDKPGTLEVLLTQLSRAVMELSMRDHPVVIAAKGAAIAGGCALLGAADINVGDRAGQYGYPVVRLGLSPVISYPTLRTLMTDGHARERLLDTALLSGEEAKRQGLLHVLRDIHEDVGPVALRMCKMLAAKPRQAFAATKQLMRELAGSGVWAARATAVSLETADTAECTAGLTRALTLRNK